MRVKSILFTCCLSMLVACSSGGAGGSGGSDDNVSNELPAIVDSYDFEVTAYQGSSMSPAAVAILAVRGQNIEDYLNDTFKLPNSTVRIVYEDCESLGQPFNAYYESSVVRMCYEMVDAFFEALNTNSISNSVSLPIRDFLMWRLIAEALVDQYELNPLADEEHTLDQIAAVLMMQQYGSPDGDGTEVAAEGIINGAVVLQYIEPPTAWIDERRFNLICLAWGADYTVALSLNIDEEINLLASAGRDCANEYAQAQTHASNLFSRFLK